MRSRLITWISVAVLASNALGVFYFFIEPALLRDLEHRTMDRLGVSTAVEEVVQFELRERAGWRWTGLTVSLAGVLCGWMLLQRKKSGRELWMTVGSLGLALALCRTFFTSDQSPFVLPGMILRIAVLLASYEALFSPRAREEFGTLNPRGPAG